MNPSLMLLADGIGDWFPWYTWVCLGALIVIIVAYKMYQKKMMS
jgi:hypothetical protein